MNLIPQQVIKKFWQSKMFSPNLIPLYCLVFVTTILCLATILWNYSEISVWRHDSIRYYDTFVGKLKTEGRWLIFFGFDTLRVLNPHIVGWLNIIFFSLFSYTVFSNIIIDRSYAIFASIVSLMIPSLYMINLWPLYSCSSFFLLALSAFCFNGMNLFLFYIFFGIMFNGALSSFYFLLPLLFINNEKSFFKTIIFWVLGFIIGYLVANITTYLITGEFIVLANWRNPHYIHSFNDLYLNILRALNAFKKHISMFTSYTIIVFLAALFFFLYNNAKKINKLVPLLIILFVILSVYAQSIPYGIFISPRTIIPLFFGLFVFVVFSFKNNKYILLLVFLIFSCAYFNHTYSNLNYYKTITSIWFESFGELKINPKLLNGIKILSSDADIQKNVKWLTVIHKIKNISDEGLGQRQRWAAVAREYGFKNVLGEWQDIVVPDGVTFSTSSCYEYAVWENFLLIKLRYR